MSKRLYDALNDFLAVKGNEGIAILSGAVNRHPLTVGRWIKTKRIPTANNQYRLALACGCTEADALEMVKEGSVEAAKESA